VDNDGGGIFSFLPQASVLPGEQFERYWGTPHGLDLAAVAAAYRVEAQVVTTVRGLVEALSPRGPGESGVRVVIARTGRQANVVDHERVNRAVAAAVGQACSGR
jgi:2-succinyl-5-enolpyruvyl-6-hydroxy-3-cyclohexene-1-carboxylate synthase